MTETWQKAILYAAAAWNVVGGIAGLVQSPTQAAWIAVIAWAAAYVGAARVAAARTVIVIAGGAGKLAYLAYSVALFRAGSLGGDVLAASSVDLVFVALFAAIAFQPDSKSTPRPRAA